MQTWFVAELNENGEIDFTRNSYEFSAINPIQHIKKAIKKYNGAMPYGYAVISYKNLHDDSKWYFIKHSGGKTN